MSISSFLLNILIFTVCFLQSVRWSCKMKLAWYFSCTFKRYVSQGPTWDSVFFFHISYALFQGCVFTQNLFTKWCLVNKWAVSLQIWLFRLNFTGFALKDIFLQGDSFWRCFVKLWFNWGSCVNLQIPPVYKVDPL